MFGLAACQSTGRVQKDPMTDYATPQEMMIKKGLNLDDGSAKDYVYLWDAKSGTPANHALLPRTTVSQYCHAKGGTLVLSYKSQLRLVNHAAQKKRLAADRRLAQGIGAYKCKLSNDQYWIVSIEPMSEKQIDKSNTSRSVKLLSKVMTMAEARQFYRGAAVLDRKVEPPVKAASKAATKEQTKKEKEAALKDQLKDVPNKEVPAKEIKAPVVEALPAPVIANTVETTQQQQTRLYVAARRDINAGRNVTNACNNAQRAYSLGKQQGAEGTRIYTESGMLVARCLNSIPSYGSRIPNAKGQAKRILTNLANNYNHSGAKNMLRQMK
ncbi:hypothetical protein [Acinetobacter sp. NCu2D-2]|uniref:hypothetical protein n=1 Tax=Acinetobacter sp. NCu2D-2 TaxID=1608473 RepID=UPI000A762A1D|nr:hypothetical protein [Acinetobacter sp. NCu2D-2]